MFGWLSEPATRDSRRNRCGERRLGGVERAQLLERHQAVKLALAREVDDRHAAAAEFLEDLVAADCPRHLVAHQWNVRWPALGSTTALDRLIGAPCCELTLVEFAVVRTVWPSFRVEPWSPV